MSATRHCRERRALIALALLLAARAADTATTIPVLLAQPSAELNVLVHVATSAVGIPGYVLLSVAAAPLIVLTVEIGIELDRRYLDAKRQLPAWLIRILCYGTPIIVSLGAVANNVLQLAQVIP